MNSKIIGGMVVVVILIATMLLLTNKQSNQQKTQPSSTQAISPSTSQNKPTEQTTTITLTSDGFSPDTLTVKAGTRVIWINKSGATATVNSANHPTHLVYQPLNLGQFADGASVQLLFNKPGTYKYHNHFNPSQVGTIRVE